MRRDLLASVRLTQACRNTVESLLSVPLLSEHLHCPDSPNQLCGLQSIASNEVLVRQKLKEGAYRVLFTSWVAYLYYY